MFITNTGCCGRIVDYLIVHTETNTENGKKNAR